MHEYDVTRTDSWRLQQLLDTTIAAIAAEGKNPHQVPVYVGVRLMRALQQEIATGAPWARRIGSIWSQGAPADVETGWQRSLQSIEQRAEPEAIGLASLCRAEPARPRRRQAHRRRYDASH